MVDNHLIQYTSSSAIAPSHPVNLFREAWERSIDNAGFPLWSGFEPADIPRALPWSMVFRPNEDGSMTYVICGESCAKLFNIHFQGRKFGENMPHEAVEERLVEFDRVGKTREALYSRTTVPYEEREFIEIHRGTFPFFESNGTGEMTIARIAVVVAPI